MMRWLVPSLRHLRTERGPAIGLALVVFLTALAAGLAPRILDRIADQSLRSAVESATDAEANVQLIEDGRIRSGAAAPFTVIESEGADREEQMADGIRSLIADQTETADSPRWSIITPTRTASTVRFRFQPGADERIRLVEGRMPAAEPRTAMLTAPAEPEPQEVVSYEGLLSVEALEELDVAVGDTLLLGPDRRDQLFSGVDTDVRLGLEIVGSFDPAEPDDQFWFGDRSLWQPGLRALSDNVQFVDVTAAMAIDLYGNLLIESNASGWSLRYTWRYAIDPGRIEAEATGTLITDFRRLESTFRPQTNFFRESTGTIIRSSLLRILVTQQQRWIAASGVLDVAAIGAAVVAAIALGRMAALLAYRRRSILAVTRSRGESIGQVVVSGVLEGLLTVGVPAAAALGVALAIMPTGQSGPSVIAVGIVGIGAIALLVGSIVRQVSGPLRPAGRDARVSTRPGPRRLASEALVVGLAIIGAFLLRERGISGGSSAGLLGSTDPFVAAVPALAGLAAGVVAIRLLPLPTSLFGYLAARRRDLVPVLAARRALRDRDAGAVLVVLLAAATVGSFSLATVAHLDLAAEAVSWHEVGAPYRLRAGVTTLPSDLDPAAVPGVTAAAGATETQATTSASATRFDVLAIDVGAYETVVGGTPGDVEFPAEMRQASGSPYPAIVSTALAAERDGADLGETFRLTIEGRTAQFLAVDVRDSFPTMPVGGRFVVISREHVRSVDPDADLPTTSLFLAAGDGAAGGLRAALLPAAPASNLSSQAELAASLRGSPIVTAVSAGTTAAALAAAVYAALAVAVTLALSGAARTVEAAHLRTLGVGRLQAIGLLVAEHGPTTLLAFVAGTGLGFAIFQLLGAQIGVAEVVGSPLLLPLAIGLSHVLALLAAVLAVVATGIALAATIQARMTASMAIRRGME
jgi:putative ABC transport system permease protein